MALCENQSAFLVLNTNLQTKLLLIGLLAAEWNRRRAAQRICQRRYEQRAAAKIRARKKLYQLRNRDHIKKRNHDWHIANKQRINDRKKVYRQANKDKIRERIKRWERANPEKVKARQLRYNGTAKAKLRTKRYNKTNKAKSRLLRYSEKHPDRIKETRTRYNKTEKAKLRSLRYRKRHPDRVRAFHTNYIAQNILKVKAARVVYRQKNAEKIKAAWRKAAPKRNAKYLHRWKTDPIFKLTRLLRLRIRQSMKHRTAQQRALRLLGCTVEEFRKYIEAQFQPGMSWDNFGDKGWHLDHVKPIAAHNLSDPEEVKTCFHFSNHQPLWWEDNLRKGAKILPRAWNGNHGLSRRIARRDAQAPAKLLTATGQSGQSHN